MKVIDVLISSKLVPSKSEARRILEQGGIRMNNKVVQSIDALIEDGTVNVGKRKFLRVHFG